MHILYWPYSVVVSTRQAQARFCRNRFQFGIGVLVIKLLFCGPQEIGLNINELILHMPAHNPNTLHTKYFRIVIESFRNHKLAVTHRPCRLATPGRDSQPGKGDEPKKELGGKKKCSVLEAVI